VNNYWIFGKLAVLTAYDCSALVVVRWLTTSHSELSTRSRGLKFILVGMVRIFYFTGHLVSNLLPYLVVINSTKIFRKRPEKFLL